jgi:hypothetical protein
MSKAKPHVRACGCWAWCETCKGVGEVVLPNTWVRQADGHYGPSMIKCSECKGKPEALKHCAAHAVEAGFDTEWRARK